MKKVARRAPKIVVDPEFKTLVSKLSDEKKVNLEAGIERDGCRHPLDVWPWKGKQVLLDGHHRLEICERLSVPYQISEVKGIEDRDDAIIWIIRAQMDHRELTPVERVLLAFKSEAALRKKTKRGRPEKGVNNYGITGEVDDQLAQIACVSKPQVFKVRKVVDFVPAYAPTAQKGDSKKLRAQIEASATRVAEIMTEAEKIKLKLLAGEVTEKDGNRKMTISGAYKEIGKLHNDIEKIKADDDAARSAQLPHYSGTQGNGWTIWCVPIEKADEHVIADGSVDWIITDPPYEESALLVWSALSRFAARVLKPGGSVIAMSGYIYLPEVVGMLGESLDYYATLAYMLPRSGMSIRSKKLGQGWKPLFWFTKGTPTQSWKTNTGDVVVSAAGDKKHHAWGQSESGMIGVVEKFTKPSQLICDPFLGAGTTGVASVKLNRKFIGIDAEAKEIGKAKVRLEGIK